MPPKRKATPTPPPASAVKSKKTTKRKATPTPPPASAAKSKKTPKRKATPHPASAAKSKKTAEPAQVANSIEQPLSVIDPAGWRHSECGVVAVEGAGQLRLSNHGQASFKHSKALATGDVLRMRIEPGMYPKTIGFAGDGFDPMNTASSDDVAWVLSNGTSCVRTVISLDEHEHYHGTYLKRQLKKVCHTYTTGGESLVATPLDVAIRCDPTPEGSGGIPQIQLNSDGVWHDFVKDRAALKAQPYYPYLELGAHNKVPLKLIPCVSILGVEAHKAG